ncbi:MAG: ferritin family protein [Deltaproteobacteria bacterium]|nr:ferritin family protein [Deltaproteobacteria bacterium]
MKASSEKAHAMFSAALEMEGKGKSFYKKAHAACTHAPGKEIFKNLMEDEDDHIRKIKALHTSIGENGGWKGARKKEPQALRDLGLIFRQMAERHGSEITAAAGDIEALDVGIGLERRSVEFYENHLKKAADPEEKEFLTKMVTEEKTHYAVLQDMKLYLSDPASWLLEKERGGLDGG